MTTTCSSLVRFCVQKQNRVRVVRVRGRDGGGGGVGGEWVWAGAVKGTFPLSSSGALHPDLVHSGALSISTLTIGTSKV